MDRSLLCALTATGVLAFGCWLASIVTRDYSWVDRLWSLVVPGYAIWFAWWAGFADARLDLMAGLATLWGARLTYNFARKGGYSSNGEDYRWAALKAKLGDAKFQVLNATFVAPGQNAVLLGLALPAWQALKHRGAPLGPLDAIAAAGFLFFLVSETIADQQQWRFQKDKRDRKARGEAVASEFVTTGLFRYSRHPNFFCEQAIWWTFYLFSVASGAPWLNPSLVGPIALVLIFQGSTAFTEKLTLEKYPAYAEYQRRVSRLWPMPPRSF